MMAKPIKTIELHYPMIQFLIKGYMVYRNTRVYIGKQDIQGYTGYTEILGYT